MNIPQTISRAIATRRRILVLVLTVLTSVTTITLMHKCVMVDTVRLQTTLPVEKIAQAAYGTVIASAQLTLSRRDTVIVHDTITTTRVVTRWVPQRVATPAITRSVLPTQSSAPDSCPPPPLASVTRTASFRDSTFAGIIDGTIIAPPDSAPLGMTYRITRPTFAPTIAFIQTHGAPVAVVSWRGEQVTLNHVVFHPNGSPWVRYIEAVYQPVTRALTIGGILGVRLVRLGELDVKVAQPMVAGMGPSVLVAVRRDL